MFSKILIANRGEIACRIIKTARRMGIETVAIYSTADRNSLHVSQADEAFCIGQPQASASYLNIDAILAAAKTSGAQAIHPGYGFLSENPRLAEACAKAGIIFIGPTIAAMEAMASKQIAKQLLEKTGVPLTPGYHGSDQSDERLLAESKQLGFPVLLKAAAGGGGKGMRAVYEEADFSAALAGARREAKASFGDDTMLIEKLISNPRHVEIQIMADSHGHIVHLYERDCSIQRRHQKIIEEAPAPGLSKSLRQGLAEAAIAVAREIEYLGAGTVEFLVDEQEHFYFMEMNTRLQVEHPVTEMITGLDLVEWQLKIAAGEPLPCKQDELKAKGHAIECRIYAEDPTQNFIPSIGQIRFLKEPVGEGLRIDSGVACHSFVTMHYDPMIAKLIAWGNDRHQALLRLQQGLKHYYLGGLKTNISFLQAIISHPRFIQAELCTDFLVQEPIQLPTVNKQLALHMATAFDYALNNMAQKDSLHRATFAWQMHLKGQWRWRYLIENEPFEVMVMPVDAEQLTIQYGEKLIKMHVKLAGNQLQLDDGHERWQAFVEPLPERLIFYTPIGSIAVERFNWQQSTSASRNPRAQLTAPMPATVVAILKNKGDRIKAGEQLMVLEAMKMEHTIQAPSDGVLTDIFFEIGAQVHEGAELIALGTENDINSVEKSS
ncbi:acetyl-CoA carboxylase biotin carboxylase subunit [Legionella oakridgensis]|uniref:Biotin carboxylase n=2 Tax=Legionella oakridgensis TaxID=29423 RepID=W0BH92_9GAMM|nr:acetyl-CoA carboxylase biotin carboxylase subunit [Legionella oakridgensis]AHE67759.1 acetyl/propionyl-CoA carboxylase, alpha, subunit [Legionella oakridgensis ATCC 33761 = DSM 21215]ETO92662.1 acetyl/propionyl-CoA carboxylase, alpha subunit [Legionella oakridgensis RV-2-2007]KTD36914.1 acyl CoA carboxylase subunit alpha [Legionella oakridgensis]STY20777.1 acyl CoA carboxylase subunit alpha [Legionella longbeachae]